MENNLTQEEQNLLLKIARQAIEMYLKYGKIPKFEVPDKLKEKRAVFVTLKQGDKLRGCIGHLEPRYPLVEAIVRMAIAAATEDNRFLPINLDELPTIKIEISVLSPLEKISDPFKIKLGEHGVIVKQGYRSGVFLPEVAEEGGYNLEEFLSALCLYKAGLPVDAWKKPETEIYIFTTKKIKE
jgi:AmmeMemoRadiSam system protein A